MARRVIRKFSAGTSHNGWLVRRWGCDLPDERDQEFLGSHQEGSQAERLAKEYADKLNREEARRPKKVERIRNRQTVKYALSQLELAVARLKAALA